MTESQIYISSGDNKIFTARKWQMQNISSDDHISIVSEPKMEESQIYQAVTTNRVYMARKWQRQKFTKWLQ